MAKAENAKEFGSRRDGVNRHGSCWALGVGSRSLMSSCPKLVSFGPPAVASPSEVLPEPEPAVEVATATSGKLSLKLAMKASPGFWDEVRFRNIWKWGERADTAPHLLSKFGNKNLYFLFPQRATNR